MTQVSDSDASRTIGDSSDRTAGRTRAPVGTSDPVPRNGDIDRALPSIQIVLAIVALVLVALVSFVTVFIISDLFVANRQAYWVIELIFAILCGGAGALIGGSAVVRSTLKIPGSPVHATVGGATAMVIVGFAVAYLGQPPEEQPMYALDIHNVPDRQTVGGDEYRVYVGAGNSDLTFSRGRNNVSIRIPARIDTHVLSIVVYRPAGKDLSRIYARCDLKLRTIGGRGDGTSTMDLVSTSSGGAHLNFSPQYIERVVASALERNASVADESCVEGRVATKPDDTPLEGIFTFQNNSVRRRALSFAQFNPMPRYSVLARDRANNDPRDSQPDLGPGTRPVPGVAKVSPSTTPEPSSQPSPTTVGATSNSVAPKTVVASAKPGAEQPSAEPPAVTAPAPTPAPVAPAEPAPAAGPASFTDQVDAYVRGEDRDRTRLYQAWGQVADYVVTGLRKEAASGSVQVARYLNLISNALNVIEDGKYLPPTLRPNWDQSVKSDRLSKNRGIPGFVADDYRIVVEALCSADEDVRRAAQRLLKVFPSYHFYSPLQALPKQPGFERCGMGFLVETATFYFYNRIVEYDGTFALDSKAQAWINENYANGTDWTKRGDALDGPRPLYSAMLDFARGLVLQDHGDKAAAVASFNQMIDSIRTSGRIYPSNPQHIATALRLTRDPTGNAKAAQSALALIPPNRHPLGKAYMIADGGVTLFAVPDPSAKSVGKMRPETVANVYLRTPNWELVEGAGQIGWARRAIASAAR